jgi:GntR family transcriptional regulator
MSERGTAVARMRDELLDELLTGIYPSGVKLPNEAELAERWGVSRATVREAVGSLVEAGYLTRRHGSGTFVAGTLPRRHALDVSVSYTSMIREAGMEPGMTILHEEQVAASESEARLLQVDAGEPLLCVERIRTADTRPVVYSLDRLPKEYAPEGIDGFGGSLYKVLERSGHTVQGASARLTPVVAAEQLAQLLETDRGTPLLHIEQVDFDAGGHPVMLSSEWHVADAFELHINRRAAP